MSLLTRFRCLAVTLHMFVTSIAKGSCSSLVFDDFSFVGTLQAYKWVRMDDQRCFLQQTCVRQGVTAWVSSGILQGQCVGCRQATQFC